MSANPLLSAIGRSDIEIITRQATVDPPSLGGGVDGTAAVTVTDVEIGDYVLPCAPYDLQGLMVTAHPAAANTVDVNFLNAGATSPLNLASGTWTFIIFKASSLT